MVNGSNRAVRAIVLALAALSVTHPATTYAQHAGTFIAPASLQDLREWDARTGSMLRSGDLRVRMTREDTLVPGRAFQRADQYYQGVRVFGADIAQQLDNGALVSVFGVLYSGIDVDTSPTMTSDEARAKVISLAGFEQGTDRQPELVILPLDEGGYRLTWRMEAFTQDRDLVQYFLDAATGDVVLQYSNRQAQTSAVGRARGVLGDDKKISTSLDGTLYTASDLLRPPAIRTYDMKGDPTRTDLFLSGRLALGLNDRASDDDNNWTDGAIDDAHVYAGYTYDYYFKRFGRRGLDNNDIRIVSLVHPVRRADLFSLYSTYPSYFLNAFYAGNGVMVYGEGLPAGVTTGGQTVDYFSGAIDIVSHELTHGVTQYSSNLIYRNESGALNESFSDMMAVSVEFMFQPAGNGLMKADYLLGEDVFRPGGIRSI